MAGLWPVVRTVFLGLMFVAIPIGFVLSTVLLGVLYYLMFTPLALWFKLRGRDTMRRKLEPDAKSYWDHRKGSAPSKRYLRMY